VHAVPTKNSILIDPVEFERPPRYFAQAMFTIIFSLSSSIRQRFRTRAALHAEILALRHQLLVLQRSSRGHHLRLGRADRLLWIWFSRFWSGWRSALAIVKPETVIGGTDKDSDCTGSGRAAIRWADLL